MRLFARTTSGSRGSIGSGSGGLARLGFGRSRNTRFIFVTQFELVPLLDGSTHHPCDAFASVSLHVEWGSPKRSEGRMINVHEAQTTFPLSIDAPCAARRWLRASGVVPLELSDAVDLVVSELVSNSVLHSGLEQPNVVSVHVTSFDGAVTGEVVDDGRGIGDFPARADRSLGLRLVERTTSRLGHSYHPPRVWFEFRGDGERPSHQPAA